MTVCYSKIEFPTLVKNKLIGDLATTSSDTPSTSTLETGLDASTLKQLASRLAQWRSMLPPPLKWAEDDPAGYPGPQPPDERGYGQALDPNLSSQASQERRLLFSVNLNVEPTHYPYAYDIQIALLRTRYYYAKYLAHRPFVFKALHFPNQMTDEDAEGVAECLRVGFHPFFSTLAPSNLLTVKIVMPQMASLIITNLSPQTTSSIPLLLVPELSRYPAHNVLDPT